MSESRSGRAGPETVAGEVTTKLGPLAQQQQEAFARTAALQAARDAVVEAAVRWADRNLGTDEAILRMDELDEAVAALLALRAGEEVR